MGVAASDQDRGDQQGDAGRGDIGHWHVDPLPTAARPAARRLRGSGRQGDIRRVSDHNGLEEGPGVSRRERPIVGIGALAESP